MKNLHTLKLTVATIGSATQPESPAVAPEPVVEPAIAPERVAAQAPATAPAAPRRATPTRRQLLALLAVEFAATLAAVAATGSIHNTAFRVAAIAVAITVALVVAIEAMSSFRDAGASAAAAGSSAPPKHRQLSKTKIALLLVMAAGFASYFGGGGAYGGFSAETTNPNSNVVSGTLTLSNSVNSGTACYSYNGTANNNVVRSACGAVFSLASTSAGNVGPGTYGAVSQVVVENTGSIDASKLSVYGPFVNAKLNTLIPLGTVGTPTTITSIQVTNLEGPVTSGDTLNVTYGSTSIQLTATASYAPPNPITTPVTINVSSYSYVGPQIPVGADVDDSSSNTTTSNTDCYDQKASASTVAGAPLGNSLSFNTGATTNSLCQQAMIFIQEVPANGQSADYCWFGLIGTSAASVGTNASSSGLCDAPFSAKLSSGQTLTTGTTSIAFSGTPTGNIITNDNVAVTENNNVWTCKAGSTVVVGSAATSLTVNSCAQSAGTSGVFTTNAVLTDTTTLGNMNGTYPAESLSGFDTQYGNSSTHTLPLYPLSSNGVANTNGPVALQHYDSSTHHSQRMFYVGVFLPDPPGTNQNTIQGLMSTFGLTWHIEQ